MTEVQEKDEVESWEQVTQLTEAGETEAVNELVSNLSPEDQRLCLSRLNHDEQVNLINDMPRGLAADVLEHLPEVQAVGLLENMEPQVAADIVKELPEEKGVDFLQDMDLSESEAVLSALESEAKVSHHRELSAYPPESAGGLMSTVVVTVSPDATVSDVVNRLSEYAEDHEETEVHYVYVINNESKLVGLLSLTNLLLKKRSAQVSSIMIPEPESVRVDNDLETLSSRFEDEGFISFPVVDESNQLLGVVSRKRTREAASDQQKEDYLHASGIVGGEELRSMPMFTRSRRRLAWLAPNILLNLAAASIIALHEDTLQAVIALAVFLPIISDMSGCSGNQAVAVSIRELTLGLIRPTEFLRIVLKEGVLGVINGFILGIILGTIAFVWKDNIWLGAVVGGALMLNTMLSVLLGGMVPLFLKKMKVDPALASGPILTTCTDMCGFFLVLNLASVFLSKLA